MLHYSRIALLDVENRTKISLQILEFIGIGNPAPPLLSPHLEFDILLRSTFEQQVLNPAWIITTLHFRIGDVLSDSPSRARIIFLKNDILNDTAKL